VDDAAWSRGECRCGVAQQPLDDTRPVSARPAQRGGRCGGSTGHRGVVHTWGRPGTAPGRRARLEARSGRRCGWGDSAGRACSVTSQCSERAAARAKPVAARSAACNGERSCRSASGCVFRGSCVLANICS